MIKPSVLLFALLISAPAWYRLLHDEVDLIQVLIRFLVAVPIAAVLLTGLRFVLAGYRRSDEEPPAPAVVPEPYESSREPRKST